MIHEKHVARLFLDKLRQESQILGSFFSKKHNLKVYANRMRNAILWVVIRRSVVFAREFIMIRLGSLERDHLLLRGGITLDKG